MGTREIGANVSSNFHSANSRNSPVKFPDGNSLNDKLKSGGWSKPIRGYVKHNVNATFDPDSLLGPVHVVRARELKYMLMLSQQKPLH